MGFALISSLTLTVVMVAFAAANRVGVFDPKTLKPALQGDLFTVQNGQPARRLTTWGYNFAPVTSGNGRFGVYRSQTQESISDPCWKGCAPNPIALVNLYLLDLERLTIRKLTQRGVIRSDAVWSADSSAFAWLEEYPPGASTTTNRLMLYSFARGRTRNLLEGISPNGGVNGQENFYLRWTPQGILTFSDPTDSGRLECVLVDVHGGGRVHRAIAILSDMTGYDAPAGFSACAKKF